MLACATSATEARFAVKASTGPVRIAYSTVEPADGVPMVDAAYSTSATVDSEGAAKVAVTGLAPGTRYWWRVEDDGVVDNDDEWTATFLTPAMSGTPWSYTFAASGDAGNGGPVPGFTGAELLPNRISNHEIHAHLGERVRAEGWHGHIYLGDIHYYNLGQDDYPDSTVANYRRGYDDLWLQPNQRVLFRSGNYVHIWDDHEFGPNDSNGDHPDKGNAAQVFREREPHHDLPDSGAIYRTFTWGRVQYVIWDCRYYRSPQSDPDGPDKTMLGEDQKNWFQQVLAASTAEVICIISSVQWMAGGADSWPGYATERAEIAAMIEDAGKADKVFMLSADAHYLAIDTGANNQWGSWPCAVFASRDAQPSMTHGVYDTLEQGGRGQYGTVTVTDLGSLITVRLAAWQDGTYVGSYTKAYPTSTPTTVTDVGALVSGSHRAVIEARVLTDYQTGPDPAGETIQVLSGDVQFDATAAVWSSMSLETLGINETDYRSLFPRFADSLLAPYGNEVYLRYGIDTGPETIWTPLGYYRVDDTEQSGSSDGPIRLTGPDRWQGLADARLVVPRQYQSSRPVGSVVEDLVLDVYPQAVISWDDDTDQRALGRDLIIEEDRAGALRDIATSHGKVIFWDSEGVLRIETAPDPETIVWDVRAGWGGVLVSSSRRVSREGMYNGVVVRGEGATGAPALGIAVDVGVSSPTRWGGRFGMVPRFYSSPLVTTNEGGFLAAAAILRRSIGMPYSVDFGTIPNPALRPRQAVRITQRDGNREIHLVDTLRIPLTGGPMTGTTREQTLVQVGSYRPASIPVGA